MKTMNEMDLVPVTDCQSYYPINRLKDHEGVTTPMTFPHHGTWVPSAPCDVQNYMKAYVEKVSALKAVRALQSLGHDALQSFGPTNIGWSLSPCKQAAARVYRLAVAYCIQGVLAEANKSVVDTQRTASVPNRLSRDDLSTHLSCIMHMGDKVKMVMWGVSSPDWIDLDAEVEIVETPTALPEATSGRPSPEFVWDTNLYNAMKAVEEFSK